MYHSPDACRHNTACAGVGPASSAKRMVSVMALVGGLHAFCSMPTAAPPCAGMPHAWNQSVLSRHGCSVFTCPTCQRKILQSRHTRRFRTLTSVSAVTCWHCGGWSQQLYFLWWLLLLHDWSAH